MKEYQKIEMEVIETAEDIVTNYPPDTDVGSGL